MSSSTLQLSYEGAKLYYSPTSCSFASFAVAHQLGLKGLKLEQVDVMTHKTASGADFYTINPKGNVPTLVFPDGSIINEGGPLLQFFSDQKPSEGLSGAPGSAERYQILNALNFISSEIHPAIGSLFVVNDANKETFFARLTAKLTYLNKLLAGKSFIANNKYSIADPYLYIALSWLKYYPIYDATPFENIHKYSAHIASLPQIKAAHEAAKKKLESL